MFPLYADRAVDGERRLRLSCPVHSRDDLRVTRILFATDFHGQRPAYDALVAQTRVLQPESVVLGGDLLPFPMVGQDPVEVQRRFVADDLKVVFAQIQEAGATLYAIHGNDDWSAAVADMQVLADEGLVHLVHGTAVPFANGWSIAGLGLVPITPFYMKDFDRLDTAEWRPVIEPSMVQLSDGGEVREGELSEVYGRPTLEAELAQLAEASDPTKTIYVVHTPPSACRLDKMHGGHHIGSIALRRFLEQHRPPLSLHGHVHESPALTGAIRDTIGETVAVNPGVSALQLSAALIDLDGLTVRHIRESDD